MKIFCVVIVVNALCFVKTEGYIDEVVDQKLPSLVFHEVDTTQDLMSHRIFRRETSQHCEELINKELCSNGYWQDFISLTYQYHCPGHYGDALSKHRDCSCPYEECVQLPGIGDYYNYSRCILHTDCSDGCRDYLVGGVERFGCCALYLHHFEVWLSCNIELKNEDFLHNLTKLPEDVLPMDCSEVNQLLYSTVYCSLDYIDAIEDVILAEDACKDSTYLEDEHYRICVVKDGKYCADASYSVDKARKAMCSNTTCTLNCKQALETVLEADGCCLNIFNTSETVWTKYEVWRNCGLESPGFCELKLMNDTSISPVTDSDSSGTTDYNDSSGNYDSTSTTDSSNGDSTDSSHASDSRIDSSTTGSSNGSDSSTIGFNVGSSTNAPNDGSDTALDVADIMKDDMMYASTTPLRAFVGYTLMSAALAQLSLTLP